MTQEPPRVYEPPHGFTRERMLGLAGTAGLLLAAVAIAVMVLTAGGEEVDATLAPTATATKTPAKAISTPRPRPTPPPLTAPQRAQRDAAVQILRSRGFEPAKLATYRGDHTLRVLIGKPAGGQPGGRLAFFFVGDRYLGNDGSDPSYRLSVGRQSNTRVTLRYGVYAPGDEACCPSETRSVRFSWDGQRVQPLDLVPDRAQRTPPQ